MNKGVDANCDLTSIAGELVKQGYTFAGRYYKRNEPSETLTLAEAKHLCLMGLSLVAIYEVGFPDKVSYFSHGPGERAGADAWKYARDVIGQPAGTPIRFTVDYDAQLHDIVDPQGNPGPIAAYFAGIAAGMQAAAAEAGTHALYETWVYGNGLVCQKLLELKLVTGTYLAMGRRMTGTPEFNAGGKWNMRQDVTISIGGIEVDTNVTNGDGGGFKI